MRRATPTPSILSTPELARRWLRAPTPEEGRVWRTLMLLQQGHGPTRVARAVGVHRNTVRNWRERYRQQGAAFTVPRAHRWSASQEESQ